MILLLLVLFGLFELFFLTSLLFFCLNAPLFFLLSSKGSFCFHLGVPFFLVDRILLEPDVGKSLRRFFVGDGESIYEALL